ncbi:hypothetical protein GW17_00032784 [Ensete ventricosum]|nr:hypothetical protein GW17_00032784 [Ensete ventricosum]
MQLKVTGSVCDVSSPTEREKLMGRVKSIFNGKLNILVSRSPSSAFSKSIEIHRGRNPSRRHLTEWRRRRPGDGGPRRASVLPPGEEEAAAVRRGKRRSCWGGRETAFRARVLAGGALASPIADRRSRGWRMRKKRRKRRAALGLRAVIAVRRRAAGIGRRGESTGDHPLLPDDSSDLVVVVAGDQINGSVLLKEFAVVGQPKIAYYSALIT